MIAYFELVRTRNNQFSFTLVAGNGKTVLQSETYHRRSGALRGIASVQSQAPLAEIRDLSQTPQTKQTKRKK